MVNSLPLLIARCRDPGLSDKVDLGEEDGEMVFTRSGLTVMSTYVGISELTRSHLLEREDIERMIYTDNGPKLLESYRNYGAKREETEESL